MQYHERHDEVKEYAGRARALISKYIGFCPDFYNKTQYGYTFKWCVSSQIREGLPEKLKSIYSSQLDAIIQDAASSSNLPLKWDIRPVRFGVVLAVQIRREDE